MATISKLTEEDTKRIDITPAIIAKGWDSRAQVRMEYAFTGGRIMVRGNEIRKGKQKKADYLLFLKPNMPLAIVEAKNCYKSVGQGIQQGIEYAQILNVPFVYSSNGACFYEHDCLTGQEREIALGEFPTPTELWERYKVSKGLKPAQEISIMSDYYSDGSGKEPRYYQRNAINKTIEAIAQGQNRILLVMATGTGKTYTAFQIIWRLWKSKQKKRILFLADRNILIDQTKVQDFAPFKGAMTKIENRTADKSYEIYLSLYQAVSGTEEENNIYKQFSKDFFDLIVIDECHRGSAKENSAWREILDYFSSATQIGMTATPKEDKDISTSQYFGKPIYTYSLKEGIEDGFLAPYKVMRIYMDKDLGWRPELGKLDKYGNEIPDQEFTQKDFDRNIVLEKRTTKVAETVMRFLRENDPYAKTIIFCENIDHATRMRNEIAKQASDLMKENPKYVMKITGDDDEGKAELDNFISVDERYPVIAVTSRLMSTGVDAKLCKLIVLDRSIGSMTEFKQIIGRGTRVNEEHGKFYFTIMDFRNATKMFSDPEFDGFPIDIHLVRGADVETESEDNTDWTEIDTEELEGGTDDWEDGEDVVEPANKKYIIDDVSVSIVNKQVQYLDENGKLIFENIKDFSKNFIIKRFPTADDFKNAWQNESSKTKFIQKLLDDGLFLQDLKSDYPAALDVYDILLATTYDIEPLTREQRANKATDLISNLPDNKREFYFDLLGKYVETGVSALENRKILLIPAIENKYGTPVETVKQIGGNEDFIATREAIKQAIYGE